eukprot:12087759-Alexandrium_andersonii.AAC.1
MLTPGRWRTSPVRAHVRHQTRPEREGQLERPCKITSSGLAASCVRGKQTTNNKPPTAHRGTSLHHLALVCT